MKGAYLVESCQPELPDEGYVQNGDELADNEGFENLDVDQRVEVLAFILWLSAFRPSSHRPLPSRTRRPRAGRCGSSSWRG